MQPHPSTPATAWLEAFLRALDDPELELEPEHRRHRLLLLGMPTDIDVAPARIGVRYILDTRHAIPAEQPVVRPAELGFECLFDPERGTLEPVLPAAVWLDHQQDTENTLRWLSDHGFHHDLSEPRSMIVREATTGRVTRELRLHRQFRPVESPADAARLALQLLDTLPGARWPDTRQTDA